MSERTTKAELEELCGKINCKLSQDGSKLNVQLRGAYGKVGLDLGNSRNVTPLMSKKELAFYMRAVLDGLYKFQ